MTDKVQKIRKKMSIEKIYQLHNDAMSLADDADILKHCGQKDKAQELYAKAFTMERQAAIDAINSGVEDLSASVLIKSSAFMAYDAGMIRESEQMVGLALSRNLPEEIAEEMRDLMRDLLNTQHSSINIPNIDDILEEKGIDPFSKEAKIFKESYYMALDKFKAQKGEEI